jgi:D-amino-acid oxidase
MGRPEILVVGAGVSGLTTAIHLAETGHEVRVIAELRPAKSTSACAGASWGPLGKDPRTAEWAEFTRAKLEKIAGDSGTGVRLLSGLEVSEESAGPPLWATKLPDYEPWRPADQERMAKVNKGREGEYTCGWRYTIPLIDMPVYLTYLEERLRAAGVTADYGRRVNSFAELRDAADVVVNCTVLGARELVPGDPVAPVRGQLVVMENPGITEFFQDNCLEENDMTYVLPHGDRVVLGGCATGEATDEELDPEAIAADIIERCAAVRPELRDARIVDQRIGFRPSRPLVRLEAAEHDGVRVIHNYGHGASGVSMSWGCAEEIGRLIG